MKRIAYCSPVNPQPSGISDYSEELLPYLGRYADVALFIQRGITPSNPRLSRHLQVHALDRLPELHATRPFDAILYHLGNSPVHAEIYELALRIPGVVVLHELVLHHFKLWYAAARRGNAERYVQEMAERYGARGESVGRRMAAGQLLDAAFEMPLVEDIVQSAGAVLAHSRYVLDRVRALRPALPGQVVPMGVPLPPVLDAAHARRELGLPVDVAIWASFGHINPYKRIESALRAFRRFRRYEPDARYLLVGSVSPSYDLGSVIRRLDLDRAVHVTGYVPPEAFTRYVAASDLCLNLRYPTAGETSASLLRLLGAARPVLVSAVDALAELPDDVCGKVEPGRAEGDLILAIARLLRLVPPLSSRLGENARRFVAHRHSLEGSARAYIDFLSSLYRWGPVEAARPPLWDVGDTTEPPQAAPLASGRAIAPVALPVASAAMLPPGHAATELLHDTGIALAELGIDPDDPTILPDVAATVADLFGRPR